MKWWYWLILELLIIFGTITWIYFFPSEIEYDFGKGLFGFALIYAIEKYRETNRRNKMSESYVVEQNVGENQIESGISIDGSVNTFRCWKCGRTLPISERTDFVYASNPPKYSCKECEGIKKEKRFRPFNDCNELIEHYQKKYKSAVGCDIYFPSLYKPCIWIRDKTEDAKGDIELITGFTEHGNVLLNGTSYPLQILFQMYEFLDGTPVGVEV